MANQPVHWKKRILLPIWLVRMAVMLFICVAFGLSIKLVTDTGNKPALGLVVFFFLLIVVVLLLDVLQILMLLKHSLTPKVLLLTSTVQSILWGGVVLTDIVAIARDGGNVNASGMILSLALLILFLATVIYAAIVFVRQRKEAKRGAYAQAHNPASMPNMTPTPYTGPTVQHHNTAYHSPMQDGGDLGQQNIPYPAYRAPPNYYSEAQAKPAQMV